MYLLCQSIIFNTRKVKKKQTTTRKICAKTASHRSFDWIVKTSNLFTSVCISVMLLSFSIFTRQQLLCPSTQQEAKGDSGNKLTQGILGKGRRVTQAHSQPPSIRMDKHQASPPLPRIINPLITTLHGVT